MLRRELLKWGMRLTGGYFAISMAPPLTRINTTLFSEARGQACVNPQLCGAQDCCTAQDNCGVGDTVGHTCTTKDICDLDGSGNCANDECTSDRSLTCNGDRCVSDSSGDCTNDGGPTGACTTCDNDAMCSTCDVDGVCPCEGDSSGYCLSDSSGACVSDSCRSDSSGDCQTDFCVSDSSGDCVSDSCVSDSSKSCNSDTCQSDSSGGCQTDSCRSDSSGACVSDSCVSDKSGDCRTDSCVSDSSGACVDDSCVSDSSGGCQTDSCVSDKSGGCVADDCTEDASGACKNDSCEVDASGGNWPEGCDEDFTPGSQIDRCNSDYSGSCTVQDVCVLDASDACVSDLCREDRSPSPCTTDTCSLDLAMNPLMGRRYFAKATINEAIKWLYRLSTIVIFIALSYGGAEAQTVIDSRNAIFQPDPTYTTGQPVSVPSPVGPFLRDCDNDGILEADTNGDGQCAGDPEVLDYDGDGTKELPPGTPFTGDFQFTCFYIPSDVAIVATGPLTIRASREVAVFGAMRLASGATISSPAMLDLRTSAWLSNDGSALPFTTALTGVVDETQTTYPPEGPVPPIAFTSLCPLSVGGPPKVCLRTTPLPTGPTDIGVFPPGLLLDENPGVMRPFGLQELEGMLTGWLGLPCWWNGNADLYVIVTASPYGQLVMNNFHQWLPFPANVVPWLANTTDDVYTQLFSYAKSGLLPGSYRLEVIVVPSGTPASNIQQIVAGTSTAPFYRWSFTKTLP